MFLETGKALKEIATNMGIDIERFEVLNSGSKRERQKRRNHRFIINPRHFQAQQG